MVDQNVVTAKLRELNERMERVRIHTPAEASDLEEDQDALDLISFNLMLCVQTCLDLATHVISDESLAPAESSSEAFQRLADYGVISKPTSKALAGAVGLRNVVAHGYAGVVPQKIHEAAVNGPADLERFSREVSAWVVGR